MLGKEIVQFHEGNCDGRLHVLRLRFSLQCAADWRTNMVGIRIAICAGTLALFTVGPALADNGNHYGWYKNGKAGGGGVTHSAPGPEFGVGLAPLLVGGYLWYRRRSKQRR